MSSTERVQSQTWPELDVRYFRWEPPVYPAAVPSEEGTKGGRTKIESAFAHSKFPPKFIGWDALRESDLEEADAPQQAALQGRHLGHANEQQHFSPQAAHAQLPLANPQAFSSVPESPALGRPAGNFWPIPGHQLQPQQYGSSFDSLLELPESNGFRYGMSHHYQGRFSSQAGLPAAQGHAVPASFTVQCGRFTAPVQRDLQHAHQDLFQPGAMDIWNGEHQGIEGEHSIKAPIRLERAASVVNSHQLQEYYSAQSELLGGLIRNQHSHHQIQTDGSRADSDILDLFGPLPLNRANSALEVSQAQSLTSSLTYMPQWQSESVPAELPNHVVNRLLMSGQQDMLSRGPRFQSASLGANLGGQDWSGLLPMPSIPDGEELPSSGLSYGSIQITSEPCDSKDSPDVNHLEELAKNADVEVAHRAFLVPPHKKRGKGGRQPALDPRLDPSIDERRAKRILANRLSAARSKMKQKNQMDVLSGMIKRLEAHNKESHCDAARLAEACEALEAENNQMTRDSLVLEEYLHRRRDLGRSFPAFSIHNSEK